MKRLVVLFLMMVTLLSCSMGRYMTNGELQDRRAAEEILISQYPELVEYYNEGVLDVTSVRAIPDGNGGYMHKLKYKFVKYHFRDYTEKMICLQERFPEIYDLYCEGLVEVTSLYKYVDRNTLQIRYYLSYRRADDYLYDYAMFAYPYGGYHYYYIPRRNYGWNIPIPPRKQPHPATRPNDRRPRPEARPNNPPRPDNQPRTEPRPETRPNNPPARQPSTAPRGQQANPRPSSPPRSSVQRSAPPASSSSRAGSSSGAARRR